MIQNTPVDQNDHDLTTKIYTQITYIWKLKHFRDLFGIMLVWRLARLQKAQEARM